MDADGLPIVGSTIDMTKVGGINQKRMLAFLNHFIIHTSHFLNRLSCVCEEKLAGLALRIQQIETSMSILEAKLASIPGLDDLRPEPEDSTLTPSTEGAPEYNLTKHTPNETSNTAGRSDVVGEDSPAAENVVTVARDARYARYLKMLQVGVPLMAIRNKMITEGLDPDLLQTPDAPVPSGGEAIKSEPAPEGNDSDSEYSLSD